MKVNGIRGPDARSISRRQLITGASVAGGLLVSSAWPAFAHDEGDEASCDLGLCASPNAIPHINKKTAPFGEFHFYFPGNVEGTPAETDSESGAPGTAQP